MTSSPCRRFVPLFILTAAIAVACGGSTASPGNNPPGTDAGKRPGTDAGVDAPVVSCNGAIVVPPAVTVVNAQTSALICGATIQQVNDAGVGTGSNLGTPCKSNVEGCPSHAPDGGALSCILTVEGGGGTQTVQVSASGYEPKTVTLTDGEQGCSGGSGGTGAITVSLEPVPQCGAIGLVPPTLVVRDAQTGALICDPSVSIEGDGGTTYVDSCAPMKGGGTFGGCPTAPPDGGTLACVFVLFFNGSVNPPSETIVVSAPGYEPKVVSGVMSGVTGCVAMPTPGSQVEVSLTAVPPDAGKGDASHD